MHCWGGRRRKRGVNCCIAPFSTDYRTQPVIGKLPNKGVLVRDQFQFLNKTDGRGKTGQTTEPAPTENVCFQKRFSQCSV